MNELNRQRPVIDLDELERQLREAAGHRGSARPATGRDHQDDPLAELARIVGQDDPFKTLWSEQGAGGRVEPRLGDDGRHPAQPSPASFQDQLDAYHQDTARDGLPYQLRQPAAADPDAYGRHEGGEADWDQHAGHGDQGYDERLAAAESEPPYSAQGQLPPHDEALEEQPRRSRKLAYAAGLVAVIALGGAGAYAFRGSTGAIKVAGAPPLIKAETGPSKIQPADEGVSDKPNRDNEIYTRPGVAEDLKNVKLSGRTEQPVDVEQITRRDLPADTKQAALDTTSTGPVGAKPAIPPSGLPQLGEPRRVKTVSVRPDGTIIENEPGPTRVASLAAVAPTTVAPPSAPIASSGATPTPVPTARPKPAPATPPTTATLAPKPAPVAAAPAASSAPPAPAPVAAAPKPAPARQQLASVQPAAPAEAASGGFAVQLAAPQSEAEARDVISRLQKRFADQLDGHTPGVRKADVNGKTIYRIRVGGLSKEDATALCTKLHGAGGQCFVAKN